MPLSPSMSWLAIGLGLFVLWQIVKRLPWEEVSEREPREGSPSIADASASPSGLIGGPSRSLTSLRVGERGQAGAPFDWDGAA